MCNGALQIPLQRFWLLAIDYLACPMWYDQNSGAAGFSDSAAILAFP
jgi:hypothetical protein